MSRNWVSLAVLASLYFGQNASFASSPFERAAGAFRASMTGTQEYIDPEILPGLLKPGPVPYSFFDQPVVIKPAANIDAGKSKLYDYYLIAFPLTVPRSKASYQGITAILKSDGSDKDFAVTGICPEHLYATFDNTGTWQESLTAAGGLASVFTLSGTVAHISTHKQTVTGAVLIGQTKPFTSLKFGKINEISLDLFRFGHQEIIPGTYHVYVKIRTGKNKSQTLSLSAGKWMKDLKVDPNTGYAADLKGKQITPAVQVIDKILVSKAEAVSVNEFITAYENDPGDLQNWLKFWAKNPDQFISADKVSTVDKPANADDSTTTNVSNTAGVQTSSVKTASGKTKSQQKLSTGSKTTSAKTASGVKITSAAQVKN